MAAKTIMDMQRRYMVCDMVTFIGLVAFVAGVVSAVCEVRPRVAVGGMVLGAVGMVAGMASRHWVAQSIDRSYVRRRHRSSPRGSRSASAPAQSDASAL